ncbi:MAG TPA: cytochrome c [Candidatus Deferrimicrobium sp.]|nr:cytochrome c [Candidatus Deferrimicrobium sp.]
MILPGRIHLAALSMLILTLGCFRGQPSDKPPIHVNPNMDHQPKYKALEKSNFFADGAAMRTPVAGTVAQGQLREDARFYFGKDSAGQQVVKAPIEITPGLLQRGQARFNIYCSPCHGRVGDGQGILAKRGFLPPPTFHSDRIRQMPDGEVFDVITSGVRNMPAYRHQIPVADRWAIITYLRALQRSQHATITDVPQEARGKLR